MSAYFRRMSGLSIVSLVALLVAPTAAAPQVRGVVVEWVESGAPAHAAGLRPGDVLTAWRQAASPARPELPPSGTLDSPFDLTRVEVEVAPRVPIVLAVRREDRPLELGVSVGDWKIRTRPAAADGGEGGLDSAEAAAARGDWTLACWLTVRMIDDAPPDLDTAALDPAALAADTCAASGRTDALALAQQAAGRVLQSRSRYIEAEAAWREALRLWEQESPSGLAVAFVHNRLGILFFERGLPAEAETHYRRALALREALAPDGLEVAATLNNLGLLARVRSELDSAVELISRSVEIRQRLVPDGLVVSDTLHNLGSILKDSGRLAEAEDLDRRALASASRIDPEGSSAVIIVNSLGTIAQLRGDFAAAQGYYQAVLERSEKLGQTSVAEDQGLARFLMAAATQNLGEVASARGDVDAAEVLYKRAIARFQKDWPENVLTANVLSGLGTILAAQRRFAEADAIYAESLAAIESRAPRSLILLGVLVQRARLAQQRGDPAAFTEQVERVRRLAEDMGPNATPAADIVLGLRGELALAEGRLDEAEAWLGQAVAAGERLYWGDERLALAHHRMAKLHRRRGRLAQAAAAHRSAVEALEAQRARLGGGGEDRQGFGVRHALLYQEAVEALVDAGQPEEAFHYRERSRARALLEMMAERDLALDEELPPALARRRRGLEAAYDRTQAALAAAADEGERRPAEERLRQLRRDQQEMADRARQASPRLASLVYPQPLRLEQARAALDPGTVLLAFAVGEHTSRLFVLEATGGAEPPLSVFTLAAGEQALREKVARFRALIGEGSAPPAPALAGEARSLYAFLLGPAESRLARAQRVLISPDGPLQVLPFAALRRADGGYLVEWKPLHMTASATLYAELRKAGPYAGDAPLSLAAFGDPQYRGLPPLPGTREEARAIGRLFPHAAVHLGKAATEERATAALATGVRYVHFASHALLDERFPLNSALALATPQGSGEGQGNGLLQAWEVFEKVRLKADLVTLSACESALGREAAGEGLLGLTRAFHYAGARSVLASLWAVTDDSTAELMKRFYAHLKRGRPKDEALQAAQREMIRDPSYAQPYAWAAFQLSGDWR